MKNFTHSVIGIILFWVVLSGCTEKQPPTHQQRLSLLNEKISVVNSALEQAEGFQKKSGNIDLQIAAFFSEYIAWELDNPEIMKDALMGNKAIIVGTKSRAVETGANIDSLERERRYQHHIDSELTSSMEILAQALSRLKKDADWPVEKDIVWNQMKFENGYFRINGRPVFSGGFNVIDHSLVDAGKYPEWAEKDKTLLPLFLQKMQGIGVGIINKSISIPRLVKENGTIDRAGIRKFKEQLLRYDQMGFKVDVRFGWTGNGEIIEQLWPGITKYYGHFVHLDIDHPGTRELTLKVMAELMPELQNLSAIVSWDLANEPDFNFDMWSPYTLKKYHTWLAEQYKTVERLNTVWKTNYSGFEAIPLPLDKKQEQCSPGEWYDMVTFHHYRVMLFFEFVQSEIRKYVPDAAIHMKGQDNSSLGPRPNAVTDGIDREMLTPLMSMQGVDTRPLPVTEPRMAAGGYDESIYGFHWLGQSFLYDYLTSLAPQCPVIDYEYHAFSINNIRVPDMQQSHPRAALWLAHLHGQISNITWYWHRRHGPNPFSSNNSLLWFYGSISAQPLIAAEYFQTMLRLNTYAKEVEALATDPIGPVRILVSKPSYIHNQAHIDALHRVYEATSFNGMRIGFVTEKMLEISGIPKGCKMIIIPDAEYVSASALKVLKESLQKGVRLVRFGDRITAYDPHGLPHTPEKLEFLKDVPVYKYAAAPELSMEFESMLAPYKADLPVKVDVVGAKGAFGVMHRQTQINGERVVLLVNVSEKPVQVQLQSKDGRAINGYDMLNGEAVKGDDINMSFEGVRLIKVAL